MRIAILTEGYTPELSGVTTSLTQRLRWLSAWGHEVRLYAPDYSAASALYPDYREHVGQVMPGVTVTPYPSRPYYVDFARDARPFSFAVVEKDMRAFGPDVIHAECPERLFLGFLCRAGVGLARRLGVPATAFYHTNYLELIDDYKAQVPWLRVPGVTRLLRQVMVWVYNSYDATMVASNVVRAKLAGFGVRNTRLGAFLGVDTERFRPAEPPAGREVTILYVGRLSPDKEIELLLRAFDLVRDQREDVHFIIAGGGPEEARVQAWAAGEPDVTFLGRIANEQTALHYSRADIFATACSKESFGLTVLEAMACGAPVVGPLAGGIAEAVEHGVTGLLFPPGDAKAFAVALLRLAASPSLRAEMRAAAIAAAQNRTWARAAQEMLSLWEGLRGRHPEHERTI